MAMPATPATMTPAPRKDELSLLEDLLETGAELVVEEEGVAEEMK